METSNQLLQRIKNAVHKVEPKATIILYGSRARGDNKPDSDWDILILFDKTKIPLKEKDDILMNIYDIELETDNIISPLISYKKEWQTEYYITPFFESVHNDGIIL